MDKNVKGMVNEAAKLAGRIIARGAKETGKFLYDHRYEAFGAAIGVTKGTYGIFSDVYGHTKTDADFNEKLNTLKEQSKEFHNLHEKLKEQKTDKELWLDSLGITYVHMERYLFVESIPEEVEQAYQAAYPDKAGQETLAEAINGRSGEELSGLVNGIKGKLFELRYVEYLNDGNLPDGYKAVLADSPINPGWDIAILDSSGNVDGLLQAKATSSLGYVQDAFEKYPDIPIVTTEEVYGHLTMHGISENVINSGISNDEISTLVEECMKSGNDYSLSVGPPLIPALIIGYSVYKNEKLDRYEKGEEFGRRYIESYVACLAGGIAMSICNLWVFGLAAALGSKYCLSRGRKKKNLYDGLSESIRCNQKILDDIKRRSADGL